MFCEVDYFFVMIKKEEFFFNGLNFYLNRYLLFFWKREDLRK